MTEQDKANFRDVLSEIERRLDHGLLVSVAIEENMASRKTAKHEPERVTGRLIGLGHLVAGYAVFKVETALGIVEWKVNKGAPGMKELAGGTGIQLYNGPSYLTLPFD